MPTDSEAEAIAMRWEPALWDGRYAAALAKVSYTPDEIKDYEVRRRADAIRRVHEVFTHADQIMK